MCHGLTINATTKLVLYYVKKHNITYPDNWNREQSWERMDDRFYEKKY